MNKTRDPRDRASALTFDVVVLCALVIWGLWALGYLWRYVP